MRHTKLRFFHVFTVFCAVSAANTGLFIQIAQSEPLSAAEIRQALFSTTTLIQILAGSAVVTAAINVIWFFMSLALGRLLHWWNAKSTVCKVDFTRGINKANYGNLEKMINGFYCLVVRYGTDQYVSTLASDQEKYEGRLKNEKRKITIKFDENGNAVLTLNLPVHKRMGTQFKCFAEAKNEELVEPAVEFLKNCDRIREVRVSKSIHNNRIYFLLDRFGETTSVDGFKNNLILPE